MFSGYEVKKMQAKMLYSAYINTYNVSDSTAKRHVKDAIELGHLYKKKEGKYTYYEYIPFDTNNLIDPF